MELLQAYARRFFPATRYLDYALRVERYTLTKAANLVLNVDGCIGALFLDLLVSSSLFSAVRPLSPCTFFVSRLVDPRMPMGFRPSDLVLAANCRH